MKIHSMLLAGVLALCGTVGWAAETASVQTESLLSSGQSWDGKPYPAYPGDAPKITVLRITIPARTTLDWHRHPVINVGYMLAGTLEVENRETGEMKTIRAGDVLPELVGTVHRGRNPADEAAVILVFYAGAERLPVSEKAP